MDTLIEQIVFVWRNLPVLFIGAGQTVQLTLAMLLLGLLIGLPLSLLQVYGSRFSKTILVEPVVILFRGIPTLVLLFLVYFGGSYVGVELSGFTAAVLAIGFRSGIYQSQIFRGAIQAVASGQMQAARAIGMSRWQALRFIVMPQALRIAIPSWSNEYAVVLKESSLAYALGVTELMRQGRYIVSRTFGNSFTIYIACAAMYFVLAYFGAKLLHHVERKYSVPGFEVKSGRRTALGREEGLKR
jgi:polar amino acid transport system permease protein